MQWVDPLGLESTFLSRILPASAGQFEINSQNRRHNQGLANIRNGNLAMANVAGYGTVAVAVATAPIVNRAIAPAVQKVAPYAGTGAKLEGAGLTVGTIGKAAAVSAGIGGGLDLGVQIIKCKCVKDVNLYQTAGVAGVSAIVSGWGAGTSAAAGFGQVGWGSVIKNAPNVGKFAQNNAPGFVIMANEQIMGQAGSRAVKSATDNKEKSNPK